LGGYASWPRQADLRGFEPAEIARLETAMWRDYYEKRHVALFGHLHELSRTEFGFAPLDSFRIALAAAPCRRKKAPDDAGAFELLTSAGISIGLRSVRHPS
jgi:hypothetical protein